MIEQWYSAKQTREILGGISDAQLWRLRRDRLIKFHRIGNRPMFPESEIAACQQRLRGLEKPFSDHTAPAGPPRVDVADDATDYPNVTERVQ